MTALSDAQRRDWVRLARTQNVGPVTFAQLIARFGSARDALKELPRLAKRGGGELRVANESDVAREIEKLHAMGGRVLASCEPEYPPALAALEPPPPVISILGHATMLQREMVAIVGARNASALGRRLAATLARDLATAGLVVASGLARGIDTSAHEGALEGGTVAVVAGGVDNIYPPENDALHARIVAQGAIVSEMPLGTVPQARHFPRRNRIISGLARGVIVVEAAEGSGSLITAKFALEQGREIFAVPGSPLDARARGANRLLKEGAVLIESAQDVIDALKPIMGGGLRDPARTGPCPPVEPNELEVDRIRALVGTGSVPGRRGRTDPRNRRAGACRTSCPARIGARGTDFSSVRQFRVVALNCLEVCPGFYSRQAKQMCQQLQITRQR